MQLSIYLFIYFFVLLIYTQYYYLSSLQAVGSKTFMFQNILKFTYWEILNNQLR